MFHPVRSVPQPPTQAGTKAKMVLRLTATVVLAIVRGYGVGDAAEVGIPFNEVLVGLGAVWHVCGYEFLP